MNKRILFIILAVSALVISQDRTIPNIEIKLLSGETVELDSLVQDGPVMINFWATWCAPCKKEMRYLDKFQKKYDGITILAISEDKTRSFSRIKSLIKSNNYDFVVGLDPNAQLFKKLGAQVVPTSILIDINRNLLWRHQGYLPGDEKIMEKEIKKALNNPIEP